MHLVAGSLKETKVRAWKGPAWKHNCGHGRHIIFEQPCVVYWGLILNNIFTSPGPWWDERDDWNALGNIFT